MLIDATYKAPQVAPGLLAWIEGALERLLQNADLDRPKLAADSTDRRNSLVESFGGCFEV